MFQEIMSGGGNINLTEVEFSITNGTNQARAFKLEKLVMFQGRIKNVSLSTVRTWYTIGYVLDAENFPLRVDENGCGNILCQWGESTAQVAIFTDTGEIRARRFGGNDTDSLDVNFLYVTN